MALLHSLGDWLTATLAALIAALGLGGGNGVVITGYADADYVRVGPELAGRLVSLSVARGDGVTAGQPLFTQDDTNDRAALAQAQANLTVARAQLANLLTGKRPAEIEVLEAQQREAEAQARLAEKQMERRVRLAETRVASVQDVDIARSDLEAAQARVGSLAAQVTVARLPARPEEVKAAEAQVAAARSAVDQAAWRLGQRAVVAPVTARVDDLLHWPGEQVAAGAPVVSLLPPAAIKVRVYVPETLIGGFHPGQTVGLTCDGCPPDLRGTVSFIASQAEYTPPVIYSTGNREKLVFLVELRPTTAPERLHPGQPVDVTLEPARP
jgi:HlyD family secretion protein